MKRKRKETLAAIAVIIFITCSAGLFSEMKIEKERIFIREEILQADRLSFLFLIGTRGLLADESNLVLD